MKTFLLSNRWQAAILIALLLVSAALLALGHGSDNHHRILSCRNELYDSNSGSHQQHYMQADFVLLAPTARIYYRYFDQQGNPVGHIAMTGKVLSASGTPPVYRLAIEDRSVKLNVAESEMPPHMAYLAQTSAINIAETGSHNLSIKVLELDEQHNYAAVYFTPSNAVCSCSVTQQ